MKPLDFRRVGGWAGVVLISACSASWAQSTASPSPPANEPVALLPGQWEVVTRRDRNGVLTLLPTDTHCVTAEMARRKSRDGQAEARLAEFMKKRPALNCRIADRSVSGATSSWRLTCSGSLEAEQLGTLTVKSPEHFVEEMKTIVKFGTTTIVSTLTVEGRRTGECPK